MMDDDGLPADPFCLARLLRAARRHRAGLAAPLVLDADAPERLAFPVRRGGRTLFGAAEVAALGPIRGFAHLFNGALVARATFERIGLPDTRLVMRGDEVEFLHRARRAGVGVVLDTEARFLHPGSAPEIHPILFGRFHAVVPLSADKRFYTFRNRGHIFRTYGHWGLLAADVVRYGWYHLVNRRLDLRGYGRWAADTWRGVRGDFGDGEDLRPGRPDAGKIATMLGSELQADAVLLPVEGAEPRAGPTLGMPRKPSEQPAAACCTEPGVDAVVPTASQVMQCGRGSGVRVSGGG